MGFTDPLPDYRGAGRLVGRRALVAGDFEEDGPGAVAAALAKEGAAVAASS